MAEGLMRTLGQGRVEVHSAGLFAAGVHPRAVAAMREAGIDITGQSSDEIDQGLLHQMDYVITLCGHAESSCPATPAGVRRIHWPIEDPVGASGSEAEVSAAFSATRQDISARIKKFLREKDVLKGSP